MDKNTPVSNLKISDLFHYDSCGELHYLKVGLRAFTEDYQGPIYIYHGPWIEQRAKKYKEVLSMVKPFYAMKANNHPGVLELFKRQGFGVDVVSGGEMDMALEYGFKPEDIIFSGVAKTRNELELAVQIEIFQINVESFNELKRIQQVALGLNKKVNIGIRVNPDISIRTHPYISTGLKENKFGVDFKTFFEMTDFISANSNLILKGISLHLGSQMLELDGFKDGLSKVVELFKKIKDKFPTLNRLDIGGGLGIFYEDLSISKEEDLIRRYSEVILESIKDLKEVQIVSEPGRWLVAHAGILITQVQYVKKTDHKKFIILDSGMNHLMRPCLYGAHHEIYPLIQSQAEVGEYDFVGPICESSDFFAKNRSFPDVPEESFVVVADVGAYGAVLSSEYNMQVRAEEIFISS